MGIIRKVTEDELVGGTQNTDIYPITSIKAVYDEDNEALDGIIKRKGVVNISTNYNKDHTAEVLTLEQAIAKIPSKDRVLGFQGKYLATDGWHTIIYTGDNITRWSDTTKWIDLPDKILRSISKNATFGGIAIPNTNPSTPDGPVFYIATEDGTYSNFNNVVLANEAALLIYNSDTSWTKFTISGKGVVSGDFISSTQDDTAEGIITFNKGIVAKQTSTFDTIRANTATILDLITTNLASSNITNTNKITTNIIEAENAKATNIEATTVNSTTINSEDVNATNINASNKIVTKNLEVTGAAHFFELVIDQVRSVGGRVILSLASCEAAHVEYLDTNLNKVSSYNADTVKYFRVYFCASDGDTNITNNFATDDLAISMTFNVGEGSYSNVSNRYYWRAIKKCSYSASTYSFDNYAKKYYYIDLYNTTGYYDADSNAIPEVGDTIVQLGNISNPERTSAIILSAYNDAWLDTEILAPCIAQYKNVGIDINNRFNLAYYRYTWFAVNSNGITGNFKLSTGNGSTQNLTDYIDKIVTEKVNITVDPSGIYSRVEALEVTVDELSTTVSENKSSIEQRADEISATVESTKTSLNELSQTVANNKSSIEQKANEIVTRVETTEASVGTLQETVNGLPLKTEDSLNAWASTIKQSAKEILLEISQASDIRRNLLPGTDFTLWDENKFEANDKTATTIIRTSDGVYGHNSIEVSSTSSSVTYPGIIFKKIPVTIGKEYCLSTYVKKIKTIAAGALIQIQSISNEDGTTVVDTKAVTYSNSSMPDNQWASMIYPFTPTTSYINVIIGIISSGTLRISLPMLEEGKERTIWTKSVKDYYYIGGNLIPNSKTLGKVTGTNDGIINSGTISVDTDGNTKSTVTATATYDSSTGTWTPSRAFPLTLRQTFKTGVDYILSFYIRRTNGPSTNLVSINLVKNILYSELYTGSVSQFSQIEGTEPYSGYFGITDVPTEWTRVWVHFRVYEEGQITSINVQALANTDSITVELKQPKLEVSAYPTEWTEAAENYIEEYNVANNLKRTGIDITQGTIHLNAENTIIDGDLHLRGVLVENYAERPVRSIQICDLVQNKSISVSQALVVLPMITQQTIGFSTGGTPKYYNVAAVTEAGVKLTIAAKYENTVAKWASATSTLYSQYPNAMGTFHNYATIVFADPRIASCTNYTSTNVANVLPEGGGGSKVAGYEGGVFICNGRRGRVLLLMPGQTLHLTSAIENINGSNHLIWYVDNGSEFEPISKIVNFIGDYAYHHEFRSNGGSSWPNETDVSSGSEHEDSLFAPKQLNNSFSGTTDTLDIELSTLLYGN